MCIGGALCDRLGRLEVLPEDRVSVSNGGFGSKLGDCAPVALDDDLVAGRTADMLVDDDPGVGRGSRSSFNSGIGGFDPLFTQVLHVPRVRILGTITYLGLGISGGVVDNTKQWNFRNSTAEVNDLGAATAGLLAIPGLQPLVAADGPSSPSPAGGSPVATTDADTPQLDTLSPALLAMRGVRMVASCREERSNPHH